MTEMSNMKRREFLRSCARNTILGSLALLAGGLFTTDRVTNSKPKCSSGSCEGCPGRMTCKKEQAVTERSMIWQIDPSKCTKCGQCATHCVLDLSAVKCVHNFSMCGYCKLCFGYFQPGANKLTSAAENQICPTGAIKRTFVEPPYFEYSIEEELCIGCAKCVAGCSAFGNGSLQLQVAHDRCLNCNECSIARACPGDAFVRVPINDPYIMKAKQG